MRSFDDDGATRKMVSSPCFSAAASQRPASSGIRSGMIAPRPPAAAKSSANFSGPYCSTGFQYVMVTHLPPAAVTSPTTRKRSLMRKPASSAMSAASWIVGPSIIGSEYGKPTSMTSAPASTTALMASIDPSTVGYPAGRYAMKAARSSARTRAKTSARLTCPAPSSRRSAGRSIRAPRCPDRWSARACGWTPGAGRTTAPRCRRPCLPDRRR